MCKPDIRNLRRTHSRHGLFDTGPSCIRRHHVACLRSAGIPFEVVDVTALQFVSDELGSGSWSSSWPASRRTTGRALPDSIAQLAKWTIVRYPMQRDQARSPCAVEPEFKGDIAGP